MIISNSTPVIHLGKVGHLDLLQKCFQEVLIPVEVYDEILIIPESMEAVLLQQAIAHGWMKKEHLKIPKLLERFSGIELGELKAISLALERKKPLLIDDHLAREVAQLFQVEVHGTLYVLLEAYQRKMMTKQSAIEMLHRMMKNQFYLSSTVYATFLELINKK